MATITVYTFRDSDGNEDSYETQDPREAQEYGRRNEYEVIANEYEWSDSGTAWDFRPDVYKIEIITPGGTATTANTWEDKEMAEVYADRAWNLATVENARLLLGDLDGDLDQYATVIGVKLVSYRPDGRRVGTETEWGAL